jgi:hypothetical protein
LAKRLSDSEKEEIIKRFTKGETLDELSEHFKCTKLTISRNLKKKLGQDEYKLLVNKTFADKEYRDKREINSIRDKNKVNKNYFDNDTYPKEPIYEESFSSSQFVEITPLNHEIEDAKQKDLSSVPLSEIDLPKIVYMIVDNKIELETKQLKDYPDWQFLPQNDLNRKAIEIFFDLKIAKRFCNKEHKIIKVPNTNVFKIVAPILLSRGISRILTDDELIAL